MILLDILQRCFSITFIVLMISVECIFAISPESILDAFTDKVVSRCFHCPLQNNKLRRSMQHENSIRMENKNCPKFLSFAHCEKSCQKGM